MGNEIFAAIGLRLHPFDFDGAAHFKLHASHKTCEFLYITDVLDREAIPFAAVRLPGHGIVM